MTRKKKEVNQLIRYRIEAVIEVPLYPVGDKAIERDWIDDFIVKSRRYGKCNAVAEVIELEIQ